MSKKNKSRNYLKTRDASDILNFGRLVAEQDENLAMYYVSDDRYVRRALDMDDPATFFIGPKGIGKSAILKMVKIRKSSDQHRIIEIRPDDLAFSALANAESTVPILSDAGKNQWLFKTLWDYVLSLEVLKREYPNSHALTGWFQSIFRGQHEKEARQLISISQGEGTSLTAKILQLIHEVEISGEYSGANLKGKVTLDSTKPSSGDSFHMLSLVNSVARKLRDNLSHSYYVLIDDLDLYWNDTPTQNAFIAALFTSLSHFSRPPSIKAVVALRENIYNALPIVDRDKYPDLICPVRWDFESVRKIVEQRVTFNLLVHPNEIWGELFPQNAFSDIWHHSNGRPREAIRLTSICAETALARGHSQITQDDLDSSIRDFSNERIKGIASEWEYKFPGLEQLMRKMSGWPKEFAFEKLGELIELIDLEVQMKEPGSERYGWVAGYTANPMGLVAILLECNILLIKQSRTDEAKIFDPQNPVELTTGRWFAIHPMFAPGLGLVGA